MNPVDKLIFNYQMVRATSFSYCLFKYFGSKGKYSDMSDEKYVRELYRRFCGRELNLDDPQTFTEKLQWLKLYDHDPLMTKVADKYAVKSYVSELIGSEHVIPCLGVWDDPAEIDFDVLPDSFVLKATHDSGGLIVVRDKTKLDIQDTIEFFKGRLKRNFYYVGRGWHYKNIPPKVIAEPYVDVLGKPDSVEYKITCINGRVEFVTVCGGIAHDRMDRRTNDFYDRNLKRLDMVTKYYANSCKPEDDQVVMPNCINEMIEVSEKLSAPFPTVRVDFYVYNDDYIFGELTFHTWDGFIKFIPKEWDAILGEKLILPDKRL